MKTNSAAGMKTKKQMKSKHSAMQKSAHKMAQESPAMESQEVAPSIMASAARKPKSAPFLKQFQGGMARRK